MSAIQVLSPKASIELSGDGVEIRKRTFKGPRRVLVPTAVVEWSQTNKTAIVRAKATTLQTLCYETPDAEWRMVKSIFKGQVYIGYSRYEEGERIG